VLALFLLSPLGPKRVALFRITQSIFPRRCINPSSRTASPDRSGNPDRRIRTGCSSVRKGTALTSPQLTRDFLTLKLGALEHEVFAVILLDGRHRVIEYVELFRGTIDGASVHPREVVKLALAKNAAAVVLAHPHPSGVAEPSQADEILTRRLRDALQLVDIRVLDHVVVAGGAAVSFAELGLL
jgi:DNA repair protein RadC